MKARSCSTPEDDFEALKEFNAAYEGETTPNEQLHLEYQRLLQDNPGLEDRLAGFPTAVFSGRQALSPGVAGVFLCFRLPALDTALGEFTLEAGSTQWFLHLLGSGQTISDPSRIAPAIRSEVFTERRCKMEHRSLVQIRDEVLKNIKNTYLKRVDAPMTAPKPKLVCWMELNDG